VKSNTGSEANGKFRGAHEDFLGGAVGHVNDIAWEEGNVLDFAPFDFSEVQGNFVFLAVGILANDDGALRLGGASKAAGKGKQLQSAHLGAIVARTKPPGLVTAPRTYTIPA